MLLEIFVWGYIPGLESYRLALVQFYLGAQFRSRFRKSENAILSGLALMPSYLGSRRNQSREKQKCNLSGLALMPFYLGWPMPFMWTATVRFLGSD